MENTIARIVSKKRLMADKIESSASAHGGPNQFQAELIKDLREEADEIEEAHQREMEAPIAGELEYCGHGQIRAKYAPGVLLSPATVVRTYNALLRYLATVRKKG